MNDTPLKPAAAPAMQVAVIDEQACIGCALCLPACPVDAIVGAPKFLHTVLAAECIGCRLCLPPCPVDCIRMVDTGRRLTREARRERAVLARRRHAARVARLAREQREGDEAQAREADQRRQRETIERVMRRAGERLREKRMRGEG